MDPLTHLIVGAAVAVVGGAEVSVVSPALIAASIGAVSPDLDIAYQSRGHYSYLKNHRGISHSIPGLAFFAALIGGTMSFVFPEAGFLTLFFWAFLGALSHTLLDLTNSYGVMLFYPFSRKKYTLNLLMITDPVLVLSSLMIIYLGYKNYMGAWIFVGGSIVYLFARLIMRRRAEALVRNHFSNYIEALVVMPSFIGVFQWDFIVRVNKKNIVGQINLLSCKIKVHKKLKLISEELKETLEKTKIGEVFKEFTPFCHVGCKVIDNKLVGVFTDMRYFMQNRFLHHALVIVDQENYQVEKSLFQPYSLENKIEIN